MKNIIIKLEDNEKSIIKKVSRVLCKHYISEISVDDLFNIIDELSTELDRLQEKLEEK